jgi:hypothetical protein
MTADDFLDSREFSFAPFMPEREGDSGALELASSKKDASLCYVVKSGFPELGCNEFMYHKVAAAVGLYTQDAKLFRGQKYKHAAAVRYVPNAKPFIDAEGTKENLHAFWSFKALYQILNEDDSEEFYLDDSGRLFKLDNASSFCLDLSPAANAIRRMGGHDIFRGVANAKIDAYDFFRKGLADVYGRDADNAYLSTFQKFAALDATDFGDALEAVEKNYSLQIASYFYQFIEARIKACGAYLRGLAKTSEGK